MALVGWKAGGLFVSEKTSVDVAGFDWYADESPWGLASWLEVHWLVSTRLAVSMVTVVFPCCLEVAQPSGEG